MLLDLSPAKCGVAVSKVEAVDGNTPQCSFAYRGWDYANGRWYYGERWVKGKFDVWNWCARRPELTT